MKHLEYGTHTDGHEQKEYLVININKFKAIKTITTS